MPFHLDDLALFARIAALGSLSAAARERDIPVSQVTRALARLETACGARLMHRSTHGLSLTDEGDTLLARGQDMLNTAEVLGAELQLRQGQPSGWVRVGVSASVAEAVIAPSLPGLYALYPQLHIDIVVDDRLADMALVADRRGPTDVAVRADLAVIPDDDVPFDDDPGQDLSTLADLKPSVHIERSMRARLLHVGFTGGHGLHVGSEEVPAVGDGKRLGRSQFARPTLPGQKDDALNNRHRTIRRVSDEGR